MTEGRPLSGDDWRGAGDDGDSIGAATDILAFQDRIAAQVAGAIHPAVRDAEIEVARQRPPGSLRAHDLVLRAHPLIWAQNAADNEAAVAMLRQAVKTEPSYGRAHALLAWCLSQSVVYLWTKDPDADRRAATEAVEVATHLIGDDPTALAAVGAAISQSLEDLDRAGTFIEAALTLDPNHAWAWARYGWLAVFRNEPDAAIERFERSQMLNPLDPMAFALRVGIAMALSAKGETTEAARIIREVLHQRPETSWANRHLAFLLAEAGDIDGARQAIARLRKSLPDVSVKRMRECHPSRLRGERFERMIRAWRAAGLPEE